MITPMWRGWASMADPNSYGRFLPEELSPSMRGNPGFLGAEVLCRQEQSETAFVTLTRFEGLNDVWAFAGCRLPLRPGTNS